MRINEWFDPNDIDHVKAYVHLRDRGTLPDDFYIPCNIIFNEGWQSLIISKMADAWVDYVILVDDLTQLTKQYAP